jgi:hypothetical protein
MTNCKHKQLLISMTSSPSDDSNTTISICSKCGEFKVSQNKDGENSVVTFSLYSNAALIAASQAIYQHESDKVEQGKRVWKPLDVAHLRLYEVVLCWQGKHTSKGKETYLVFADSPNQTAQSAAKQIEKIHKEIYDQNPMIESWWIEGFSTEVLQPIEWTENGVSLFNHKLIDAVRRLLNGEDTKAELAELVKER